MPNYSKSPYSVSVSSDGKILVKRGDTLSKYSWAIYGNYTTLNAFKRLNSNGQPIPIQNVDLIYEGETLIHLRDYKPGNGNGGGVGINPPANGGSGGGSTLPPTGGGTQPPVGGGRTMPLGWQISLADIDLPKKPKDISYFRFQFNVSMKAIAKTARASDLTQDDMDRALCGETIEKIEKALNAEIAIGNWGAIEEAVRINSQTSMREALGKQLQVSIAWSRELGNFKCTQILGLELSSVPFSYTLQYTYADDFAVRQIPCEWSVEGSGTIHLGLSRKGWWKIASKVGKWVCRRFAKTAGRGLVVFLEECGIFAGVVTAILVVVAWNALLIWLASNVYAEAEKIALADWYSYGYCHRVFPEYYPRNPDVPVGKRGEMARLGREDCMTEVRDTLRESGQDELAAGPEAAAIAEFKAMLLSQHNDDSDYAFEQLRSTVRELALSKMT